MALWSQIARMRVVPSPFRKSRCRKSMPESMTPTITFLPVPAVQDGGVPTRSVSARVAGTLWSRRRGCGRDASIDLTLGSAATAATLLAGMSTVAMSPITDRTRAPCALTASRLPSKRRIVSTNGSAMPGSKRTSAGFATPFFATAESVASSLSGCTGVAACALV